MVVVPTEGERPEQPVPPLLMERGVVKRAGRGRSRSRPDRVGGGKGTSSPTVRRSLRGWGIWAVISKAGEAPDPTFDQAADRKRNAVEQASNRLKQHRRIAIRSEKRVANDLAMVSLAVMLL